MRQPELEKKNMFILRPCFMLRKISHFFRVILNPQDGYSEFTLLTMFIHSAPLSCTLGSGDHFLLPTSAPCRKSTKNRIAVGAVIT